MKSNRKDDMGAHAIDPSAPEAEADGTLSAPGQTLCLKKKKIYIFKKYSAY